MTVAAEDAKAQRKWIEQNENSTACPVWNVLLNNYHISSSLVKTWFLHLPISLDRSYNFTCVNSFVGSFVRWSICPLRLFFIIDSLVFSDFSSDISKKWHFFKKKRHQKFDHPYSIPFLSVVHQNLCVIFTKGGSVPLPDT